jgi:hypothetical protein
MTLPTGISVVVVADKEDRIRRWELVGSRLLRHNNDLFVHIQNLLQAAAGQPKK